MSIFRHKNLKNILVSVNVYVYVKGMAAILLANLLLTQIRPKIYLPKHAEETSRNTTVNENDLITAEELKINLQYRRLMSEKIAL